MRIVLLTHFFPPEKGAPQVRLSDFARRWAAAGHEVTVLTGLPNHPSGVIHDGYYRSLVSEERRDGYRVVRTWLYATPNKGVVKRMLNHLSWMVTSMLFGSFKVHKPDVVVASSPTFFSLFSAWWLALAKRAALVVEIRDLWPALIVELGVLSNRPVISVLEAAELWVYRRADAVVVVTEGFRQNLTSRGIPSDKVFRIPNGVDFAAFDTNQVPDPRARQQLGAEDGETLILYIGTHGISQGLSTVIEAANLLDSEPIQFAFVGDGAEKDLISGMAAEMGLENVSFHDPVPREQVPRLISAADAVLVPLRDAPLLSTFIPSKMFEIMALGVPIVGILRGEAAEILERVGAAVVPPGDADRLAVTLRSVCRGTAFDSDYPKRARALVEAEFDRGTLAGEYLQLLEAVD